MLVGEVLAFLHRYNRVVVTLAGVLGFVQLGQLVARLV
jgi:hypothetical protein